MSRSGPLTVAVLAVFAFQLFAGCGGGGDGGNQLPTVTITSPRDGEDYLHGETIGFAGTANDPEDGRLTGGSLVWTASPGGTIGTGESCTCDYLSIGTHTIRFTARDSQSASASASITINIVPSNRPPDVTILGPADGATFFAGESIVFSGSATDPEDGPLTGDNLVWTAGILDEIGTGELFTYDELPVATHTITLTATDSEGASASESITIEVRPPNIAPMVMILQPTDNSFFPHYSLIEFEGSTGTDSLGATGRARVTIEVNAPPTVTIYAPTDGASFYIGCPVTFEGGGDDPEDGVLPGGSLVWTSSLDGAIGTGELLSRDNLHGGTHTISLVGTDSGGKSDSESVAIEVHGAFFRIISVNSSAFPTIEARVFVDTDAAGGCGLVENDFAVAEDLVPQVIDSVTCEEVGPDFAVEIVVVFDDSGSMGAGTGGELQAMQDEVKRFADDALDTGLDARFGLVSFRDTAEVDLTMTSDVAAFKAAVDALVAEGGEDDAEVSLDAVVLALNSMSFRGGVPIVILLITDGPAHYRGDGSGLSSFTMPEVIEYVGVFHATVFAVSPDSTASAAFCFGNNGEARALRADAQETDVRELAEGTDGIWLDIASANFSVFLDEILTWYGAMSFYAVVYTTSNQVADGTVRYMRLAVTDPDEGVNTRCTKYTAP